MTNEMKLVKRILTSTYDAGDGYYVDIVEQPNEIVVWLYHKDYSYKRCIDGTRSLTSDNISNMFDRMEADLDHHKAKYDKWVTDIQILE